MGDFEFGGLGLGFFLCVVGVFDLGIFVERERRRMRLNCNWILILGFGFGLLR